MEKIIAGRKFNIVDEKEVLSDLLLSSKEFQDYYSSQRSKIPSPLYWSSDSKILEDYKGLAQKAGR